MNDRIDVKPTRGFWIIGIAALVWNLLGIATYLMDVTRSEDALANMTEAEQLLYTSTPAWATSAYAIAVFGGTLACIVLLLRKSWAVPLFVISLIAIFVQMGHGLFMTKLLEVRGASAAILPVVIILVALYLVRFSSSAKQKGWLSS